MKNTSYKQTLAAYVTGFVGSIILTLTAYIFVTTGYFSGWTTAILIIILALVQCFVQLIFFLHLSDEKRPRWRLLTMISMLIIFVIVIFGSIWVMYNLNDRMMPTHQEMTKYMDKQIGF